MTGIILFRRGEKFEQKITKTAKGKVFRRRRGIKFFFAIFASFCSNSSS